MAVSAEILSELNEVIIGKINSGQGVRSPRLLRLILGSGYHFQVTPDAFEEWTMDLANSGDPSLAVFGNSLNIFRNPFRCGTYLEFNREEQLVELLIKQSLDGTSRIRRSFYRLELPKNWFSLDITHTDNGSSFRSRINGPAESDHLKAIARLITKMGPMKRSNYIYESVSS